MAHESDEKTQSFHVRKGTVERARTSLIQNVHRDSQVIPNGKPTVLIKALKDTNLKQNVNVAPAQPEPCEKQHKPIPKLSQIQTKTSLAILNNLSLANLNKNNNKYEYSSITPYMKPVKVEMGNKRTCNGVSINLQNNITKDTVRDIKQLLYNVGSHELINKMIKDVKKDLISELNNSDLFSFNNKVNANDSENEIKKQTKTEFTYLSKLKRSIKVSSGSSRSDNYKAATIESDHDRRVVNGYYRQSRTSIDSTDFDDFKDINDLNDTINFEMVLDIDYNKHINDRMEQKQLLNEIGTLLNIKDISLIQVKKCKQGSVILHIALSVLALMFANISTARYLWRVRNSTNKTNNNNKNKNSIAKSSRSRGKDRIRFELGQKVNVYVIWRDRYYPCTVDQCWSKRVNGKNKHLIKVSYDNNPFFFGFNTEVLDVHDPRIEIIEEEPIDEQVHDQPDENKNTNKNDNAVVITVGGGRVDLVDNLDANIAG